MSSPCVSVVICTYNQQAFVRETLDSILSQTYPHLEIIVTDDGSTDQTPDILRDYARRFPAKIRIVLSDHHTGIPANFNRGLAQATGEWLVCMDGDDLMLPDKIEKQARFLVQHPEATGCYHDSEVFDTQTGQTLGRMSVVYNGTLELKQGQLRDWFVPRNFFLPASIMYRADKRPAHGYDERSKYLSEVVYYAEIFRKGVLLAMPDVLMRYRRHAQNVTDDPAAREAMLEYELLAYAILEARYPELHPVLVRLRTSCRLAQAIKCYREGDYRQSRTIIRNVMRDGAVAQGLAVYFGTALFGPVIARLTSGKTFTRPHWVKRLARLLLR